MCPAVNRLRELNTVPPLQSYCKINLGLKITGQRADGYHTLQTIMQEVTLADTLILEPSDDGWQFSCDRRDVPADEKNLCVKAYRELRKVFPNLGGVRIHLEKRIPIGAGLGGGSSNAATVLKGMNRLYELSLGEKRLEEIALSIGADVPFFIHGRTQSAEGIGEILTFVSLPPMEVILLVVPHIRISTEWAYSEVRKHLTGGFRPGNFAAAAESSDSWQSILSWDTADEFFENDFESLVFQTYPEIGGIRTQLLRSGALFASLSGSGSTVFGVFRDEVQALETQAAFSSPFQTFLTYPVTK